MRAVVAEKNNSLIPRISPSGVAKQSPCYNVVSRKRRRFLNRWIKSLATVAGRVKIKNELRRRIRHNRYWVADTVGFIRHLPHDLVAAFKATLQETRQATLLLHVIDAADVRVQENIEAVNTVLEEIDAHEIPTLLVMNKIDMLDDFEPRIDRDEENKPIRVWLSAQTGAGIPQLFQALTERLSGEVAQHTLRLPPQEGRLRSRFYQLQAIEKEWMEEDGSVSLQVRMPIVDWRRLCKQEPALIDYLI